TKSKAAMREKYGLDPKMPTIILSLGGFGVGRMDTLLRALRSIRRPAQILAMCGRNQDLKNQLEAASNENDIVRIIPIGYTRAMDEYMTASDLIVGKPGGLTTCESLAKGLGFVIVDPIPGQEERNADHLLENGCAIRCNNPATIAYKIGRLLAEPDRLKAMRHNALAMARPDAAFEIVDRLVALS
ncbi:MAG TPA: glycosyltransferase, partial [Pyrinomonadaceae bacterium]